MELIGGLDAQRWLRRRLWVERDGWHRPRPAVLLSVHGNTATVKVDSHPEPLTVSISVLKPWWSNNPDLKAAADAAARPVADLKRNLAAMETSTMATNATAMATTSTTAGRTPAAVAISSRTCHVRGVTEMADKSAASRRLNGARPTRDRAVKRQRATPRNGSWWNARAKETSDD